MSPGCMVVVAIALLVPYSAKLALWIVAIGVPLLGVVNHFPSRGLREAVEKKGLELREMAYDVIAEMEIDEGEGPLIEYASVGSRLATIEVVVEHKGTETLRVVLNRISARRLIASDRATVSKLATKRPPEFKLLDFDKEANAGISAAIKRSMMAMTTRSSSSVNAE